MSARERAADFASALACSPHMSFTAPSSECDATMGMDEASSAAYQRAAIIVQRQRCLAAGLSPHNLFDELPRFSDRVGWSEYWAAVEAELRSPSEG